LSLEDALRLLEDRDARLEAMRRVLERVIDEVAHVGGFIRPAFQQALRDARAELADAAVSQVVVPRTRTWPI
jgi:citrate lyase beta subunit